MTKLLSILTVVLLLAACTKKDSKPALTPQTTTAADIIGKWQLVLDSAFATNNGQGVFQGLQNQTSENAIITYDANGLGSQAENGQTLGPLTYTVANGVIKIIISGSSAETDLIILTISTSSMLVRINSTGGYIDAEFVKQ